MWRRSYLRVAWHAPLPRNNKIAKKLLERRETKAKVIDGCFMTRYNISRSAGLHRNSLNPKTELE